MKTLGFDTITTMAMDDDEDAKSKKHADNRISESEMKTSSQKKNQKGKSAQRLYNLITHVI